MELATPIYWPWFLISRYKLLCQGMLYQAFLGLNIDNCGAELYVIPQVFSGVGNGRTLQRLQMVFKNNTYSCVVEFCRQNFTRPFLSGLSGWLMKYVQSSPSFAKNFTLPQNFLSWTSVQFKTSVVSETGLRKLFCTNSIKLTWS